MNRVIWDLCISASTPGRVNIQVVLILLSEGGDEYLAQGTNFWHIVLISYDICFILH